MKPITAEWVAKAEADYDLARRELDRGSDAQFDAVCFHAQQCAEKYLKACLQEADIPFPKTHDLPPLLDRIRPPIPALVGIRDDLDVISGLAVDVRYPGFFAEQSEAAHAVSTTSRVRDACRIFLRVDPE